ncbi:MAG: hypothetical protein V3U06_09405, partial [Candidatus Binatia bacterium]
ALEWKSFKLAERACLVTEQNCPRNDQIRTSPFFDLKSKIITSTSEQLSDYLDFRITFIAFSNTYLILAIYAPFL